MTTIRHSALGKSAVALVATLLTAGGALAHHSGVMFDSDKEVTLKGTIKEFIFQNPHVRVVISVPGKSNASATDWNIEAASVRGMAQAGWRRSTLQPGDEVTIVGHPLRDGRPGANLMRVVLADGTVLNANAGANY